MNPDPKFNPDACAALGISVPADAQVTWQWV